MNKKALLVVSFGTSYNDSRKKTIEAIEQTITTEFPDFDVRCAYTSRIIIRILAERDGIVIDSVDQAMKKLVADGYNILAIQPTHVMSGIEYEEMMGCISTYEACFTKVAYGKPLLTSDGDYAQVALTMTEATAEYNRPDTAVVFMGHGTEHKANAAYEKLAEVFSDAGYANYFVGTVEAQPSLEDMVERVKVYGARRVVLVPLMIVAGDHANHDMAGSEKGSWKQAFLEVGCEVVCVIKGMGEYEGIRNMFVAHGMAAAALLNQ